MIYKWQVRLLAIAAVLIQPAVAHDLVDPMMPQLPKAKVASTAQKVVTVVKKPLPVLRLDAVTIIDDFKVAFVNGSRFMIGDKIQEALITDIGSDWIMVLFEDEFFRIEHTVPRATITPAAAVSEETM